MSINIELTHRLEDWKHWCMYFNGFPEKSVVADFGSAGGSVAPCSKPLINYRHEKADLINSYINRMGSSFPEYKFVITSYYLDSGNIKEKSQRLKMDRSDYYKTLKAAHRYLAEVLSFEEEMPVVCEKKAIACSPHF